jgi:transglutaminase-like putative cysteine protease
MRLHIRHTTTYRYPAPATHAVLALRLTAPDGPGQKVLDWQVAGPGIDPTAAYTDAFGNTVLVAAAPNGHTLLEISAIGTIETFDTGGVAGHTGEAATPDIFLRSTPTTAADAAIARLAESVRTDSRLAAMHALMGAVHQAVAYDTSTSDSRTTAAEAMAAGSGVCQDHAHIMLAAARLLGIPARYVTGYLYLEDEAVSAAHHAWMEAHIETLGWVGFDAANDVCPTENYVRLATGLDAASAAPIRGVRRGDATDAMQVEVSVTRRLD